MIIILAVSNWNYYHSVIHRPDVFVEWNGDRNTVRQRSRDPYFPFRIQYPKNVTEFLNTLNTHAAALGMY